MASFVFPIFSETIAKDPEVMRVKPIDKKPQLAGFMGHPETLFKIARSLVHT